MPLAPDPVTAADQELKQKHKAMWGSGDYSVMVDTFLLPLGPRLVRACGIGPGMRVLDVAAGTGNASLPAAKAGAHVTASDLTPELLEAGRARGEAGGARAGTRAGGLKPGWPKPVADTRPFETGSSTVVMSSMGAMSAPPIRTS